MKYVNVEGNTEEEFGGEGEWESTPQLYIPVWLNFPLLTGQVFTVNGCLWVCVCESQSSLQSHPTGKGETAKNSLLLLLLLCPQCEGPPLLKGDRRSADCQWGLVVFALRTAADKFVFIQQEKNWESSWDGREREGKSWEAEVWCGLTFVVKPFYTSVLIHLLSSCVGLCVPSCLIRC